MKFSGLHIAANVFLVAGSTVVYACAVKGSWCWTLAGVAIGTIGGVAYLLAPSPFVDEKPGGS